MKWRSWRSLLRPLLAAGLVVLLLPQLPLGSLFGDGEVGACCGMSCCVGATSCCCPPDARVQPSPKASHEIAWDGIAHLERDCDPACGASAFVEHRPGRKALLRVATRIGAVSARRRPRPSAQRSALRRAGQPDRPRGPPSFPSS